MVNVVLDERDEDFRGEGLEVVRAIIAVFQGFEGSGCGLSGMEVHDIRVVRVRI